MAEKVDKARAAYQCKGCDATAATKEVKHAEHCKTANVKKVCTKSGTAPHDK